MVYERWSVPSPPFPHPYRISLITASLPFPSFIPLRNPSVRSIDTLRAYLSQYGPLEACMVMKNPEGRSRGFAFAVFANPRDIDEMLKKEHVLDGKTVLIPILLDRKRDELTSAAASIGLYHRSTSSAPPRKNNTPNPTKFSSAAYPPP